MMASELQLTPAKQIRLRDGRSLAYAEYGDPEGKPIFYFHGWVGSRLDFQANESIARSLGARVIAADRPGTGLSDFKSGRKLLDWPDDVAELADALGIERFAVLGWSFGGPYVLACAFKIPERLTAAGMVAGLGIIDRPGATKGMMTLARINIWLARHASWLSRLFVWQMGRMARSGPDKMMRQMESALPQGDQTVLERRPEVGASLAASIAEMFRSGNRGVAWDGLTVLRGWGFGIENIQAKVHLWQGEADRNVPLQMGKRYTKEIPHCKATFYPGEGHFIFFSRAEEILRTLIAWGSCLFIALPPPVLA